MKTIKSLIADKDELLHKVSELEEHSTRLKGALQDAEWAFQFFWRAFTNRALQLKEAIKVIVSLKAQKHEWEEKEKD